jgi:hypothetical protein
VVAFNFAVDEGRRKAIIIAIRGEHGKAEVLTLAISTKRTEGRWVRHGRRKLATICSMRWSNTTNSPSFWRDSSFANVFADFRSFAASIQMIAPAADFLKIS